MLTLKEKRLLNLQRHRTRYEVAGVGTDRNVYLVGYANGTSVAAVARLVRSRYDRLAVCMGTEISLNRNPCHGATLAAGDCYLTGRTQREAISTTELPRFPHCAECGHPGTKGHEPTCSAVASLYDAIAAGNAAQPAR